MDVIIYIIFVLIVLALLIMPERLKVFSNRGTIIIGIFFGLIAIIMFLLPIGKYFIPH